MGLELGNLLGAVANVTTAFSKEKSLKSFLSDIDSLGVQVKNNFEVNFSGLTDITFRVQDIQLPSIKANTTQIYYDGRTIPVLVNYDYEHDFTMNILNDSQGYIYTIVSDFLMSNLSTHLAASGYTMTIKALTGDKDYKGSLITCTGVKLTSIQGLDFGQNANDVQIFSVSGTMQEYNVSPGALGQLASIVGAINSVVN